MKRRLVIFITFILAPLVFSKPAMEKESSHGPGEAEREILQLENRRFDAMTRADATALDRILADELSYTHSTGRLDSKAAFIASLKSGQLKYESISTQDVRVRVIGDAGVVTGRALMKVRSGAQSMSMLVRFTDVYLKRDGRWQMIAWQSTRLAQQ